MNNLGNNDENSVNGVNDNENANNSDNGSMNNGSMNNGSMNNSSMNNGSMNNSNNGMAGGRRRRTRKNNRSSTRMEGGAKIPAVGSHAQVWNGNAKHTSGGLTKSDLMKNKHGRIVSKKKHALGKKSLKHLRKAGYVAKKGTFKLFRKK